MIRAPSGRTRHASARWPQTAAVSRTSAVARPAQAAVAVHARRHAPAPDRRARHRHRAQAVRDGPRRPGRAADDGLPAADDQRHRARRSANLAAGQGDARRSPTSRSSPTRTSCRAASPCAAATFGQCIDAVGALDVDWGRGTVDGKSDADVLADLKKAELPLTPGAPARPRRSSSRSRSTSAPAIRSRPTARSPTSAAASAEIWSSLKSPIWAQEQLAPNLGLPLQQRQGARHPGRRLVRPPPVRRRRVRGGGDLEDARQAGEADVAPHRQLPPGPRAPDVHLARPHDLRGRQRARASTSGTRASPPTSRMGFGELLTATLATLPAAQLARLLAGDLHPDRRTCPTTSAPSPSC